MYIPGFKVDKIFAFFCCHGFNAYKMVAFFGKLTIYFSFIPPVAKIVLVNNCSLKVYTYMYMYIYIIYTVYSQYVYMYTSMKLAGDQKSSLQSGASNRNGRMRVNRRTQFRTSQNKEMVIIEDTYI